MHTLRASRHPCCTPAPRNYRDQLDYQPFHDCAGRTTLPRGAERKPLAMIEGWRACWPTAFAAAREPGSGTKRTSGDVRSSVAIGGKPDIRRIAPFGRE